MKLRNKITGEIVEATDFNIISEYSSLAKLNEDWEDYNEEIDSKIYYFIDLDSSKYRILENYDAGRDSDLARKEIGNYFKNRLEVERVVEKLKAWKRLKDNGLIFCGWKITDDGCSVDIETTLDAEVVRAKQKYITDDLNLIFGEEV